MVHRKRGKEYGYRGIIATGVGFLIAAGAEALFVHQNRAGRQQLVIFAVVGLVAILAGIGLALDLRRYRRKLEAEDRGPVR